MHEYKSFQTQDALTPPSGVGGLITWLFEEDSFSPIAKIKNDKHYSIINDHLGTPIEGYDDTGALIWERQLNANGKVITQKGIENFCPFLYQGQSFDNEIELAYNRFRYYDVEDGRYISQDPIGLLSGEFGFYNYVEDPNSWLDVLGLHKNSNSTVGDWVLYEVVDPKTGVAKIGIGKADDVMADGTNRRAHNSARKVKKDNDFKNAKPKVISTHKGITKGEMKEIEAKKVRELRKKGNALPHNKEKDKRYKPGYKGK